MPIDLDDQTQVPLDDPDDLRADPVDPHPRLLPDRVAGAARAGRQVRAGDVRRPHHRHLAVPARPGEVRHGHPVPGGPAGLGRAGVPAPRPARRARGDLRASSSSTSRCCRSSRRSPAAPWPRPTRCAARSASPDGQPEVEVWLRPARARPRLRRRRPSSRVWEVLKAFASFGFCKAHAAAFALPTYQSAWLKTHHPAAFLAGVLTHDPGMYPKRLILDDARQFGIAVLRLDVNASDATYRVERVEHGGRRRRTAAIGEPPGGAPVGMPDAARLRHPALAGRRQGHHRGRGRPDRRRPALRARWPTSGTGPGSPGRWSSGWCSPAPSTPCTARGRLVAGPSGRQGRLTRRDLLLQVGELDRWTRTVARSHRSGGRSRDAGHARPVADRIAVAAASGESLTTVQRSGRARASRRPRAAAVARPAGGLAGAARPRPRTTPRGRSSPAGCRR